MKLTWVYTGNQPTTVRSYIQKLGLSRGFMKQAKYHGGGIYIDGQVVTVRDQIKPNETLMIQVPDEEGHDSVKPSYIPIDIIYEDRDCLVINKPADTLSIPSVQSPDSAMANRIRGYYVKSGYADQVIHIVTRLDRDTTGLMLVAKHRMAHAYFDRQLQNREITKQYLAISHRSDWPNKGQIEAPIGRSARSIIERVVRSDGRPALTSYQVKHRCQDGSLLELTLHTGRTHQIRVHLAHEGGPLVGDTLYGGFFTQAIQRQALHCHKLEFIQPFTGQKIQLQQPIPEDMKQWWLVEASRRKI